MYNHNKFTPLSRNLRTCSSDSPRRKDSFEIVSHVKTLIKSSSLARSLFMSLTAVFIYILHLTPHLNVFLKLCTMALTGTFSFEI